MSNQQNRPVCLVRPSRRSRGEVMSTSSETVAVLTRRLPRSPVWALGKLSGTAAFYLQVSIIMAFLAGSSAPTPLYAVYQAAWGFSPVTITVVFGVYALAVLAALLVFGALSDHVGRRPVLLATTLLQAVT